MKRVLLMNFDNTLFSKYKRNALKYLSISNIKLV